MTIEATDSRLFSVRQQMLRKGDGVEFKAVGFLLAW